MFSSPELSQYNFNSLSSESTDGSFRNATPHFTERIWAVVPLMSSFNLATVPGSLIIWIMITSALAANCRILSSIVASPEVISVLVKWFKLK